MSLLDDARHLNNSPLPTEDDGRCWFCEEIPAEEGHHGCPWLAMPKIVAVLEAAERLVESMRKYEDGEPGTFELLDLARALRGDEVTA